MEFQKFRVEIPSAVRYSMFLGVKCWCFLLHICNGKHDTLFLAVIKFCYYRWMWSCKKCEFEGELTVIKKTNYA